MNEQTVHLQAIAYDNDMSNIFTCIESERVKKNRMACI